MSDMVKLMDQMIQLACDLAPKTVAELRQMNPQIKKYWGRKELPCRQECIADIMESARDQLMQLRSKNTSEHVTTKIELKDGFMTVSAEYGFYQDPFYYELMGFFGDETISDILQRVKENTPNKFLDPS